MDVRCVIITKSTVKVPVANVKAELSTLPQPPQCPPCSSKASATSEDTRHKCGGKQRDAQREKMKSNLHGVTDLSAVLQHLNLLRRNRFCPRCRAFGRNPDKKDELARIMKRDKEKNPTHEVGLHFPDGDVGAL